MVKFSLIDVVRVNYKRFPFFFHEVRFTVDKRLPSFASRVFSLLRASCVRSHFISLSIASGLQASFRMLETNPLPPAPHTAKTSTLLAATSFPRPLPWPFSPNPKSRGIGPGNKVALISYIRNKICFQDPNA